MPCARGSSPWTRSRPVETNARCDFSGTSDRAYSTRRRKHDGRREKASRLDLLAFVLRDGSQSKSSKSAGRSLSNSFIARQSRGIGAAPCGENMRGAVNGFLARIERNLVRAEAQSIQSDPRIRSFGDPRPVKRDGDLDLALELQAAFGQR